MKITVERKWKKEGYTIGVLWIDGERICNTLEPTDRGLVNKAKVGILASEQWQEAEKQTKKVKAEHTAGTTAIPTGYYRVVAEISSKFNAKRLYLRNVPGFSGVMIHEGNTRKDTRGCILVGENTIVGHVQNSKYWLKVINDRVFAALQGGDTVILSVKCEVVSVKC